MRKRPRRASATRSRLVHAITRTSTRSMRLAPTCWISPSWSTRSSFACTDRGSSPTSSRTSVPPFATEKNPSRARSAPVKAPRAWPNNSASASSAGIAAQLNLTSGFDARALSVCRSEAMTSLPVPVSPRRRTVTSFGPTSATIWSSSRIAADSATMRGAGTSSRTDPKDSSGSKIRMASPCTRGAAREPGSEGLSIVEHRGVTGSSVARTQGLRSWLMDQVRTGCPEADPSPRSRSNAARRQAVPVSRRSEPARRRSPVPTSCSRLGPGREDELERGTRAGVARGPQTASVGLDDRPADREPHAHSTGLGGEEGIEQARDLIFIESDTHVLHGHENRVRCVGLRSDDQVARPTTHPFARLDAVHQQIEDALLQLDPIALDRRQCRGQLGPEQHAVLARLAVHQRGNLLGDLVDVQRGLVAVRLLHQRTDPPDHLASALSREDDLLHGGTHFFQIRRRPLEPVQASMTVGHDRGQRLVHLVGNGGGQLAHRHDARHMRELRLRQRERLLRLLSFGDVLHDAEDELGNSFGAGDQRCADVHPDLLAVLPEVSLHELERGAFAPDELRDDVDIVLAIVFVGDHPERQLPQLSLRVAEHGPIRGVHGDEPPAQVGEGDPQRRALEDRAPPLLALAELLLGAGPFAVLLAQLEIEAGVFRRDRGLRGGQLPQRDPPRR